MGRIMVPNNFHALIPGTYDYITFHGKRNFADVIRDTDFQIGRLSWVIQRSPVQLKESLKILSQLKTQRDVMTEHGAEKNDIIDFESGGRGAMSQLRWEASRSWKRQGNGFSPRASRRKYNPATPSENCVLTTHSQSCKVINLRCFCSNLLQWQQKTNMAR